MQTWWIPWIELVVSDWPCCTPSLKNTCAHNKHGKQTLTKQNALKPTFLYLKHYDFERGVDDQNCCPRLQLFGKWLGIHYDTKAITNVEVIRRDLVLEIPTWWIPWIRFVCTSDWPCSTPSLKNTMQWQQTWKTNIDKQTALQPKFLYLKHCNLEWGVEELFGEHCQVFPIWTVASDLAPPVPHGHQCK